MKNLKRKLWMSVIASVFIIATFFRPSPASSAVYHDEDLSGYRTQFGQLQYPSSYAEFEDMTWEEVQEDLRSVLPVLYEVNLEGNIGGKLKSGEPLDTFEKALLGWMAQRYELNAVARVSSTLEKNVLESKDYNFLLKQFRKVLRLQRTLISRHIQLRIWLHSVITVINAAEPDDDYDAWLKQNLKKISSMKALEKAMVRYARDLGTSM